MVSLAFKPFSHILFCLLGLPSFFLTFGRIPILTASALLKPPGMSFLIFLPQSQLDGTTLYSLHILCFVYHNIYRIKFKNSKKRKKEIVFCRLWDPYKEELLFFEVTCLLLKSEIEHMF